MIGPTSVLAGARAAALHRRREAPASSRSGFAGGIGSFGITPAVRLQRGDALSNGSRFFVHHEGMRMRPPGFLGRTDGTREVLTRDLALCVD